MAGMSQAVTKSVVSLWEEFFDLYAREDLYELAAEPGHLKVEYAEVERFDIDLADELVENPDRVLAAAERALEEVDLKVDLPGDEIKVRIEGLPDEDTHLVRDLRSEHIGRFISVEGLVRKATDIRPRMATGAFECQRCGEVQSVEQDGSELEEPYICRGCERKGPFEILRDESEFFDSQKLQLQESPEELAGGEQPQSIDVHVKGELAGEVSPGNRVKANGILRSYQRKSGGRRRTLFDLFIDGNSIEIEDREFEEIEISAEDREEIEELAEDPAVYGKIIDSISPTIYGYEDVKEAIALQLFSGVSKQMPDDSYIRGDIHVLLIGDPGMGKSQILRYVRNLAPRGVYASGKSSTSAGLCVSPETLVRSSSGYQDIEDFVEERLYSPEEIRPGFLKTDTNGESLQALGNDLSGEETPLRSVWKINAPEEVIKVTTESGRRIELTPSTALPVREGNSLVWRDAAEICTGDILATPRELEVNGDKPYLYDLLSNELFYVDNAADLVEKLKEMLSQKYGSVDDAVERIDDIDGIYHWSNENLRGNPPFSALSKMAHEIGMPKEELYKELNGMPLSQKRGHFIRIPARPDETFMHAVGLIAGDGAISSTKWGEKTIRFSSSCEPLMEHFRKFVDSLDTNAIYSDGSKERGPELRFNSKLFAEILHRFGIPEAPKSSDLTLTPELLDLEDSLLSAYLRGLFDADGSVNRHKSGGSSVELYTTSEELVQRVHHALLRFGILSQRRSRDKEGTETETQNGRKIKSKNDVHILTITGSENLRRFERAIGFTHPKKAKTLRRIEEEKTGSPNRDLVEGIGPAFKKIREYLGVPRNRFHLSESGLHGIESGEKGTTRETLSKLVDELEDIYQKDDWRGCSVELNPELQIRIQEHMKDIGTPSENAAELDITETRYQEYFQRLPREDRESCRVPFKVLSRTVEYLLNHGHGKTGARLKDEIRALERREDLIPDEIRRLKSLAKSSVYWDAVAEVSSTEPEYDYVYDVTVDAHNFVANSVFVHNTAAAVKDEFGEGKWSLEAGALVMADKGIACIDEVDKMRPDDRSALHEAMEQQSLSIAKAGITTTLKTRCALLGAANPKYGRFDKFEPVAEQINMEPALLSRFDLIFTLSDQPSEEGDSKIAEHILGSHQGGELIRRGDKVGSIEEVNPPIEPELMKKYVAVAKNVFPVMSDGAMEKLRDFYVDLRNMGESDSPVPVTARQLEALVRLAESSARIRLDEEATEQDASRAIRIVKKVLAEVGVDPETDQYDIDVLATGVSKSQRDRIRTLKDIIRELESEHGGRAPKDLVLERAEETGIRRSDAKSKISKMRESGEIYYPDHDHMKTTG